MWVQCEILYRRREWDETCRLFLFYASCVWITLFKNNYARPFFRHQYTSKLTIFQTKKQLFFAFSNRSYCDLSYYCDLSSFKFSISNTFKLSHTIFLSSITNINTHVFWMFFFSESLRWPWIFLAPSRAESNNSLCKFISPDSFWWTRSRRQPFVLFILHGFLSNAYWLFMFR